MAEAKAQSTGVTINELPFLVFILIADAEQGASAKQYDRFQKALSHVDWCRSEKLRKALPEAAQQYNKLWKQYSRGSLVATAAAFQEVLSDVAEGAPRDDLKRDIAKLANSLIGSSAGRKTYKELVALLRAPEDFTAFTVETKKAEPEALLVEPEAKKEKTPVEELATPATAPTQSTPQIDDASPAPPPSEEKPAEEKIETTSVGDGTTLAEIKPHTYMPLAFVEHDKVETWEKGKVDLKCVRVIDETHDVKTFRFVADPPVLFQFNPGQFVTLDLKIDGSRAVRSYTISSSPTRPNLLDLTVKRVEGGLVSNWMHDNIRAGDRVAAKGPSGKFSMFNNPGKKLLLLSGGSGVTPMMSMARWVLDSSADCDVVFFHNAHTTDDIIFNDELNMMVAAHDNFRLFIALTRQSPDSPWDGLTGRLDGEMLQQIAPDLAERKVFVCGPRGFMTTARELIEETSFDLGKNYREESFGAAPKSKKRATSQAAPAAVGGGDVVTIDSSGPATATLPKVEKRVAAASASTMPAVHFSETAIEVFGGDMDVSLLDLAEEIGIEIPNSCRTGSCGTCKALCKVGDVATDSDEGLSQQEKADGFILTCVAYPEGYVDVEL